LAVNEDSEAHAALRMFLDNLIELYFQKYRKLLQVYAYYLF
jgi:hypothetical protein